MEERLKFIARLLGVSVAFTYSKALHGVGLRTLPYSPFQVGGPIVLFEQVAKCLVRHKTLF